jgi:DNA-binding transcriptional MerR regulator
MAARKPESRENGAVRALTISDLERASGIPRSTIHFYIREGLLPQPQKTAGTRALYSDDHLSLLGRITEAKTAGLSLSEIRAQLQTALRKASEQSVDLEAQEYGRVHNTILRFATLEFSRRGYRRTQVATLIKDLGISSSVFYEHFPSKYHLLVECFSTFLKWGTAHIEPQVAQSTDMVERLLKRTSSMVTIRALGTDVLALVNDSKLQEETDLRAPVEEAWRLIMRNIADELASFRPASAPAPTIPDELLAYSLNGALERAFERQTWDDRYTQLDVIRTHVWLWLAVRGALDGRVDADGELVGYEDLIKKMVTARPPDFPPLEE